VAECPVYGNAGPDVLIAGVADAVALDDAGHPEVVIDWKSDVRPDAAAREHYRTQVRAYLAALGCRRGLLVYLTEGAVETVRAAEAAATD
jgi:exodeoxyribonuclease-5